jgi:hypothetical protein
VYHPLILFLYSKLFSCFAFEFKYKVVLVYSLVLGTTLLISYISFELFESKFIKMKNRFAVIKSSGSRV